MHNNSDEDECPQLISARVPVTILTGFLGSGKTTLLHHVLSAEHTLRIAVIVNEFEFGRSIEKGLTVRSGAHAEDEWVELKNGCMCCSSSTATVAALEALMARKGTFDLILVETAGLADPAPVAAMFWQDAALCGQLYLSGIVALVDALHLPRYLADDALAAVATRQLVVADKIVVNKCDLVTGQDGSSSGGDGGGGGALAAVCACVRRLNPAAEVLCTTHARVSDLRQLLFMNTTASSSSASWLQQLPHLHHHSNDGDDDGDQRHDHVDGSRNAGAHGVTSLSFEFADATRMLALHTRDDLDNICKTLLYHDDDDMHMDAAGDDDDDDEDEDNTTSMQRQQLHTVSHNSRRARQHTDEGHYEVLRCKAALWLYTPHTRRSDASHTTVDDKDNNNDDDDDAGAAQTTSSSSGAAYCTANGTYTLLQLQSIGRVFDVHVMATASTPLCCSRVLVLGRRLDADVIGGVFARYLQPTVTCTE